MKSTFNAKKEEREVNGTEWVYGAIKKDLAQVPYDKRLLFLPLCTWQYNSLMDAMGCASRSPVNILSSKFTYFYHHDMHPALKSWLKQKGYVVGEGENAKVLFDETYIEILSGTTKNGNSLKAPLDAIRHHGLIPEMLPLEEGMTWEQYHDPNRITDEHRELGKEFKKRFVINYEIVPEDGFMEALQDDYIDVAGHGWNKPKNGVYERTNKSINHAFLLVDKAIHSYDDHEQCIKLLAKDYRFFKWGYSISVTAQNPFPEETLQLFEVLKEHGLLAFFAEAVKRLWENNKVY